MTHNGIFESKNAGKRKKVLSSEYKEKGLVSSFTLKLEFCTHYT